MRKCYSLLAGLMLFMPLFSACDIFSSEEDEDKEDEDIEVTEPSLTWDGKDPWFDAPSQVEVVSFDTDSPQRFDVKSNVLSLHLRETTPSEHSLYFYQYPEVMPESEDNKYVEFSAEGNYTLEDRRSEFEVLMPAEGKPLGHFAMIQKGLGLEADCKPASSSVTVDFKAGNGVSTIIYALSETAQEYPYDFLKAEGKKVSVSGSYSAELTGLSHSSDYILYAAVMVEDWLVEKTLLEKNVATEISSDPKDALVFTVSANPANDFTVHIPLDFQYESERNYTIDWGDGTVETNGEPNHKYNVTEAAFFDVRVSGKVTGLDTDNMPSASRGNTVFAVKQWGNTGLTKVQLCGLSSLESIAPDTEGAFSKMLTFGSFDQFSIGSFEDCTSLKEIPADLFKYAVNVTDFNRAFCNCTSLTLIPEGLFAECRNVKNFEMVFYECKSLKEIPPRLFENNTEVTDFSYAFSYCESLREIPAALFLNNGKAINFTGTFERCTSLASIPKGLLSGCPDASVFGENFRTSDLTGLYPDYACGMFQDCKALTSIPEDLLSYCPEATDVSGIFAGCSSLASVPEGLFDANTKLKYVSGAFQYCSELKEVPVSLFDHNHKIVLFRNTFAGCVELGGESPYMMKDGKKVHLYEREDYKFDFPEILDSVGCFENCRLLSDYNEIRPGWH